MKAVSILPSGYHLLTFDTIDSTNEEARRQIEAGSITPLVIMADEQTKGRGRHGRRWLGENGNLMCTILLRPRDIEGNKQAATAACGLSFVGALAVADAIKMYDKRQLSLKWPNDVLLDGEKISGILVEASGGTYLDWCSIGIGVNLVSVPDGVGCRATCLRPPERDKYAFLGNLLASFERWFTLFQSDGFAPLKQSWLTKAEGLHQAIHIQTGEGIIEGCFRTIGKDGALHLSTTAGERVIHAGEIIKRSEG